jgi:Leucine-rich repeat (LRR) protein
MPFYPESDLPLPNNDLIKTIQSKNILILPINKASNLFSISMINSPDFRDGDLSIFNQIKDNIVNLDLSNSEVTDSIFSDLKTYSNLTVLKLSNTKITGNSIEQLSILPNLKRLYLVNTSFQEKFIEDLIKFKNLESVFLFKEKNPLKTPSIIPIEKLNIFDFGNYKLEDL